MILNNVYIYNNETANIRDLKTEGILKDRYRKFYRFRDNEFNVALKFSRVIEVNIFGEENIEIILGKLKINIS